MIMLRWIKQGDVFSGIGFLYVPVIPKKVGALVINVFQGAGFDEYFKALKQAFKVIKTRKPDFSRARSREVYLVATGWKL